MGKEWIAEMLEVFTRWLVRLVISVFLGVFATVIAYNFATSLGVYRQVLIGMTVAILVFSLSTWRSEVSKKAREEAEAMWLKPSWGDLLFSDVGYAVVSLMILVACLISAWAICWLLPDWIIHQVIRALGGIGIALEPTIGIHVSGFLILIGLVWFGINSAIQESKTYYGCR